MSDKTNTIAGWVLFGGVIAIGLSSVSSRVFSADKPHAPHEAGYEIVAAEEGEGESGPSLAQLLATADIGKGESVFAKCSACHTINQGGANGIGPNLYGVMGKPVGQHVPGFAYSGALSDHGGTWDWANMDAWLASPRAFASGTKMSFAGLSKPEDRANIIAYINAQGSNLPLPAVEASAEEEIEGGVETAEEPAVSQTPEGADAADAETQTPVAEEGTAAAN